MAIDQKTLRILEEKLYAALVPGRPQVKVARLIADAFSSEDSLPDEDDINAALEALVSREDVTSFGLIKKWRHSEIMRAETS